ncbi:galactose-specific lectin nattectin-like [Rhinichthys klamathensis goyatoka]|uniref:galactose-specific lectin nattectin-like n=1 Tax=Rhinichthys klamathensis goyatoka TaxID=3034132 RepID=UPI0024B4FF9C|nr:galactose-specific lectin nattectin-like [Rhinichthys klamathensis goyatoka]
MEKLTLLLLLMTFSQGDAAADGCPTGWSAFGLKCVKFFSTPLDWMASEKYCQTFGGNLVSVHSRSENDLLLNMVPGATRTWIGGHDAVKEGQWMWTDGSVFDYNYWCTGQPDNYNNYNEIALEINFGMNITDFFKLFKYKVNCINKSVFDSEKNIVYFILDNHCWNDDGKAAKHAFICARSLY